MISETTTRPTILIVDDRAENLLALSAILTDVDAVVIEAASGAEALEKLLENEVALVLLDVQMPDMDGYEVASIMRSTKTTELIPIIFLTAISTEEFYVEKGYETGAVDFIQKPLNTNILLSKVAIFLKLWKQSQQLKKLNANYQQSIQEITKQRDELNELAIKDFLTGLYQRRVFDDFINKEISRAVRHKGALSIAMMDLDFFKKVNDNYGHLVGDEVLVQFARILQSSLRESDIACRFGGEEFVVMMPMTSLADALIICERIRTTIEQYVFHTEKGDLQVTISIGLSEFHLDAPKTAEELLKIADDCLYQAKKNGRNQIYPQSFDISN